MIYPTRKKKTNAFIRVLEKRLLRKKEKSQKDQLRDYDNPGKKTIVRTVGMERETKRKSRKKHLKIRKGADLKVSMRSHFY